MQSPGSPSPLAVSESQLAHVTKQDLLLMEESTWVLVSADSADHAEAPAIDVDDDLESEVSVSMESSVSCEQSGWQMIDNCSLERSVADASSMEQSVATITAMDEADSMGLEAKRSMLIGVNTIPENPVAEEQEEPENDGEVKTETMPSFSGSDLIGEWRDSIGNDISVVFIDAYKETLQAELDRGIGDVCVLKIKRDEDGNWKCGNGILDLEKVQPSRLVWNKKNEPGEGTVWIRTSAPAEASTPYGTPVNWAGLNYAPLLMPWLAAQKHLMLEADCQNRSIKKDRARGWRRGKKSRS